MKHTCKNCSFNYEFTEEQLKWCSYDTFCPECHYSLGAQDEREKYLKIIKEGEKRIINGVEFRVLDREYVRLPIKEGFSIGYLSN